jgi:hypothetical protein
MPSIAAAVPTPSSFAATPAAHGSKVNESKPINSREFGVAKLARFDPIWGVRRNLIIK